jgi:hypothetical protein
MNIIIFDTETLGFKSQDLLNVGYRIIDLDIFSKSYKVLCERDMLDMNLWQAVKKLSQHKGCLESDMETILTSQFLSPSKMQMYENLLKNKQIERHCIRKVFEIMQEDMRKFSVVFAYAYNCNFDIDKFEKTALKYGINNPLKDIPIFDIWAYAVNHICYTEDYIKWARENEIFTQTETYISTSVESVTKYLLQDLTFVESHTALSDTQWETKILVHCFLQGCDITKSEKRGSYIPSGKVFHKKIITPQGEIVEFDYQKSLSRSTTEYHYE